VTRTPGALIETPPSEYREMSLISATAGRPNLGRGHRIHEWRTSLATARSYAAAPVIAPFGSHARRGVWGDWPGSADCIRFHRPDGHSHQRLKDTPILRAIRLLVLSAGMP
jgi:hypothetical protein